MRRALIAVLLTVAMLPVDVSAATRCNFEGTPMLIFGPYDIFSPVALTATGHLLFECNVEGIGNGVAPVLVSLSPGNSNNALTRTLRQLAGGSDVLNYNIFSDPGHTQIWGGILSGNAPVVATARNNTTVDLPMYGLIPAHQDPAAGRYSDTLILTMNF